MFCINEKCNTCKMWGSEESHISIVSSERSTRSLREASKGVTNSSLKSLIVKEAFDKALYEVLTNEFFPHVEHLDLFRVNVNELKLNLNIKSVILRSC